MKSLTYDCAGISSQKAVQITLSTAHPQPHRAGFNFEMDVLRDKFRDFFTMECRLIDGEHSIDAVKKIIKSQNLMME
jgi:hypothetical protein